MESKTDGVIIRVVECCIGSTEEHRQPEAHIIWRNTEVWTEKHTRVWENVLGRGCISGGAGIKTSFSVLLSQARLLLEKVFLTFLV